MSISARSLRHWLVQRPRSFKRALQVIVDICLVWLAVWLSFTIRLGVDQLIDPFGEYLWLFLVAPLTAIPLFIRFGLYRAVLRYFDGNALLTIFNAVTLSTLLLAVAIYVVRPDALMPRSVVFIYWCLTLLLVGGVRLLMRQYFVGSLFSRQKPFQRNDQQVKVAIYGAGAAGNQLVTALRMGKGMLPVAFIDDDEGIVSRVISGLQVYEPSRVEQMLSDTGAEEVLLAIPSASRSRRKEILDSLGHFPLRVRSIPGFMDLAAGRVSVSDLQEVEIADLLGRDAVPPQQELFERCIREKVVMVTGAGGSIGSELCWQILATSPSCLILFEHSEFNLYSIQTELENRIRIESLPIKLISILGTVRNQRRLQDLMSSWQVDTIYHAAAYKHVPIVEHNIAEGVLNNVQGTLMVAQAAVRAGVANFVLISTDKAVRPTNVMGCSKRLAEMLLQALSREAKPLLLDGNSESTINQTRFTMVRFGNVLGSSGSVIPLFRQQIEQGGPVTVTHPEITRYFMTIPEAAQLVIQAGAMGQGGDVFVLDMGEPVKIFELAQKMVRLSGLSVRSESNQEGDIAIEFTGLRPGEKLYEELLIGDNVTPTEHPMIMRANEEFVSWPELAEALQMLFAALEADDYGHVRKQLCSLVNGYAPESEIVDWVYLQRMA
ncbi:NDP-sugar epimerase, includes UDP-GlcNAc-inverting 4,6-dehydratase FlaA1 and capsular polysaccharide biosynthesis protein EpsC [Pseudomonas pohangensis]|uniref:NDP-sugar epimerase, includes UDP-GlcNAc-inverting 4,6-dehydratase FlaA1 and capsular polysaccharide biosynthesis protein EpsC n=1 Tax=Pseudomonas pohangensis TaxID=364197 RepID=A0A1H2FVP9_9PSED|nr:nucleoside-diphosphate sugar epimerase/dehydratase [Pseudomonas pohangensis]SDU11411.1 NDP-sugar epimerase, includes UDP-GlcNAc-inverting 4,6-dehydratase FlaA1 and capsular polysaccharide biosynthesis protein EpsC [Pseudomonas pohangensis]